MTILIKQCIVYGRFTYNQAQTMHEIDLGSKPLSFDELLRKYPFYEKLKHDIASDIRGLHKSI